MMGKKMLKYGALAATGGLILQFGGCLGGNWQTLAWGSALYAGLEFVTDNDSVFDLFQDDFGTGTQYDDRFLADPTRAEPDEDAQDVLDLHLGR